MICPLSADKYGERHHCYSSCAFYDSGCLLARALKAYIEVNSPIMAYNPIKLAQEYNQGE